MVFVNSIAPTGNGFHTLWINL